ncbi:MAG TPA: hypothetical protein VML50_00690 [Anaeromyxobacter sp.]|nr:hypothetical protein [Anaeromyxobacter sp.]
MAREGRLAVAAAAFGAAAVLASWNPLAAPFGLVVGLGALGLSVRALLRGGRAGLAAAALGLSLLAVAGSAVVLARTAGVGRDPTGEPVVPGPAPGAAAAQLDDAEARTRAARERARSELEGLEGAPPPAPARRAPVPGRSGAP